MPSYRSSDHATVLPLFKEGPSVFLRVGVLVVLSLCLMVADTRFQLMPVLRQGVAVINTPLEWAAMQPVRFWGFAQGYFGGLNQARMDEDAARVRLAQQSLRAAMVESLLLENMRLRELLGLRERAELLGRAAEVIYEVPDPYSQKLIVDRGLVQGIVVGSPVLDDLGVVGQVSRVLPMTSEVTLLTNEGFTVAVTNARTGIFGLAFGAPKEGFSQGVGMLELRFMPPNTDVREGDLLVTSGIDGVYPVGLPVARVSRVEYSVSSMFMRIWCEPVARIHNTRYVMIVQPSMHLMEESQSLDRVLPLPAGLSEPAHSSDRSLPSASVTTVGSPAQQSGARNGQNLGATR